MVDIVIVFAGVAVVFVVVWCVIVAAAMAARPPTIEEFHPRAELDSDLMSSVSLLDVKRGAEAMSGVRVATITDVSLLVSVAPRLGSLDRGTGEWVLITRGTDRYRFGIRAKTPVNLTTYADAVVEFERELRMMLRRQGVVRFDLRESAASPHIVGRPPDDDPAPPPVRNPAPGPPQQWWTS